MRLSLRSSLSYIVKHRVEHQSAGYQVRSVDGFLNQKNIHHYLWKSYDRGKCAFELFNERRIGVNNEATIQMTNQSLSLRTWQRVDKRIRE